MGHKNIQDLKYCLRMKKTSCQTNAIIRNIFICNVWLLRKKGHLEEVKRRKDWLYVHSQLQYQFQTLWELHAIKQCNEGGGGRDCDFWEDESFFWATKSEPGTETASKHALTKQSHWKCVFHPLTPQRQWSSGKTELVLTLYWTYSSSRGAPPADPDLCPDWVMRKKRKCPCPDQ